MARSNRGSKRAAKPRKISSIKPAPEKTPPKAALQLKSKRRSKSTDEDVIQEAVPASPFPIVGIGASAGGLEAFRDLLKALPNDTGLAFVLVQHLDPVHESMLTKLLARNTAMPIAEATDGMEVVPNHLYVIPPNTTMGIVDGKLSLTAREDSPVGHMTIDHFLHSLADDRGNKAIGVILSGNATDGTLGLKAIKSAGGITFAQDAKTARFDGMPLSAISAGCVDRILSPAEIARELDRIRRLPNLGLSTALAPSAPPDSDGVLQQIFDVLQNIAGVNFTHYKCNTTKRRIARRMLVHKIGNLKDYLKFLQENPTEPEALCEDILIHVTGFFREPEAFPILADSIVPRLLTGRAAADPIRVWVPGCSTGEEVYSIAMVLLETLSERRANVPIQIFGTDVSDISVERARSGIYLESALSIVKPERIRRFFNKVENGYQISKDIRERCVFARQDLGKDPPFSRLDLISCRNVLIYMAPVLQRKVVANFHYALKRTGFLILGKSESIAGYSDLFTQTDWKYKVYTRTATVLQPAFPLLAAGEDQPSPVPKVQPPVQFDVQRVADRIVLGEYAPPGVVIDESMQILSFRGECSPFLSPLPGEASLSLLRMVRAEFAVELRTAIHRARKQERSVRKDGIRVERNGSDWDVTIQVIPFKGDHGERYYLVMFADAPASEAQEVPASSSPKPSRRKSNELENLRRELKTTKEYLQAIIEEQEAVMEELKSANEEALSSNEELQSTNEELETAKEELQSTNEELVTVNEQLQSRNAELAVVGDDLANLFSVVAIAVIILDRDLMIRRFTPQAAGLLNLTDADVGRAIHNLRLNLHVPDLVRTLTAVMENGAVHEQEIQSPDGRWFSMRARPYRTGDRQTDGVVLLFIDIDALRQSNVQLLGEQRFTEAVLQSTGALVKVTDLEGRMLRFNRACELVSGYSAAEVLGRRVWDLFIDDQDREIVRRAYSEQARTLSPGAHESWWNCRTGARRLISWVSSPVTDSNGDIRYIVSIGTDNTEARHVRDTLRQTEVTLRQSEAQLRRLTVGLFDAQDNERQRIARELHDDIVQRLAALAIDAHLLEGKTGRQRTAALKVLELKLGSVAEDLRRTAHELHPMALSQLGLGPALRSYCEDFSNRHKVKIRFAERQVPYSVPPAVATCIYRVVQEALGNIAAHAHARKASVTLDAHDGIISAVIADDGVGFDLDNRKSKGGLGLISMEERVREAQGIIAITSKPGAGTSIDLRIPIVPDDTLHT